MSHNDWHPTTEQLSALLDEQLASDEQARLQTHLRTCQQCQLRLADLQQTVTLLHALPQPVLPRSFMLPVDDAVVTPISASRRGTAHSQSATQLRRPARPGYIRTTMRTLSAIAAILGIVFLLSTALPLVQGTPTNFSAAVPAQSAKSTAGGSNNQSPGGQSLDKTTPQTGLTPRATTPHATATPASTVQAPQPVTPVNPPLFDLNNVGERAFLGLILLVAGVAGFFLLSRWRTSKR